ncbi:MAG: hypothetical protein V7679_09925 [Parasphingorhabdus sp.]
MNSFYEGFVLAHVPSIVRVRRLGKLSLKKWLETGTYVPKLSDENDSIIFDRIDIEQLSGAIAFDVDRLAKAGRESLEIPDQVANLSKSSAWTLIKIYYSAFYFAQSLIRICGYSPIYLSGMEAQKIKKTMKLYSVDWPFGRQGALRPPRTMANSG